MLTGDFPVLPRSGRSPKERSLYLGGKTMNKTELIAAVAEKAELSKKDAGRGIFLSGKAGQEASESSRRLESLRVK